MAHSLKLSGAKGGVGGLGEKVKTTACRKRDGKREWFSGPSFGMGVERKLRRRFWFEKEYIQAGKKRKLRSRPTSV